MSDADGFANLYQLLLPAIFFIGTFCLILAVSQLSQSGRGAADDRLDALHRTLRSLPGEQALGQRLLNNATQSLSSPFQPRSESELGWLKRDLAAAGFQSTSAIATYSSIRLISLVFGAFAGTSICLVLDISSAYRPTMLMVGLVVGLYLPRQVLGFIAKRRQKRIFKALPDTLDLLIISIDAGQGLDGALKRIVETLSPQASDLGAELKLFLSQLNMGMARREALHLLGARSGTPELNSFAAVLNQADRFGSSIAESLRDLSESIRLRRRHMAEEKAQQTAVKLIFPLVLFIFPGIFSVLVGPAAISLYRDFAAAP